MKIVLFILLAVGMYFLVRAVRDYEPAGKIREKIDELYRRRLLNTELEKRGVLEKYLDRLEEHLLQAGVKSFSPKLSVEFYFLFNVVEFTLIFCLSGEGILVPLLKAGAAIYMNKMILDILRYRRRKVVEKHLLAFLNLVSDYSLSESEITTIFFRCGQLMPRVLREALTKCHLSAANSGNSEKALCELRRSVDHFLFQEIILLLEVCSLGDSDYRKVINGCRGMVSRYLKEEKEKVSVVRSLVIEALLMTGVAVYGISTMLKEFGGNTGSGNGMVDFFFHSGAGQICLIIYLLLCFAMLQAILKFAKR
ncbi:MAG: hypothetical protein E7293_04905 [Lachnospiraceae bacterium]|nr:hypothetical protein [Lachnospiraceae bacterium]